ncbi:angiopoietin-like protein 8 [Discoglossus pictus]
MLMLLLLLVLPFTQGETDERPAVQEEVNVLLYGTLQLSQALADTYQSTTNRVQRAMGRQNRQEWGLERLHEKAVRARKEEQRLRKEVERLQREEREIRTLSSGIEGELRVLQREYRELQRRVHGLEDGVQWQKAGVTALKEQTNHHNLILQVLEDVVTKQQAQMAKQRWQLNHILRKVSTVRPR